MATFTWTVLSVDVSTELLAGHDNIVTVVYWQCVGEQDGYFALLERNSKIPFEPATWVAYADLTESKMLGWVFVQTIPNTNKDAPAITIQTATEAEIQQMLDVQITPTAISPALPWAN